MKSTLFISSVLLALLVVVACAPPAPPAPPAPSTNGAVAQETPPVPPITPPPIGSPADPAIRAAMEKAATYEAQGISYFYSKTVNDRISTELPVSSNVWQKGDTLKLTPPLPTSYNKATVVHVVVLDTAADDATGYCTSISICGNDIPEERSVAYVDYAFITPFDWLDAFKDIRAAGEETVINNKLSLPITATVNGSSVQAWLDKFSGVPLQVQDGTTVYKYDKLGLGVKDADLQP